MNITPYGVNNLVHFDEAEVNEIIVEESILGEDCTLLEDMELETTKAKKRKGGCREDTNNSSEEDWTRVSRGRKVGRKNEEEGEEEVENVQVCVTSQNALPKQFALAKIFEEYKISNIEKVKYVSSSKIIITFEKESSADLFIQSKVCTHLDWRCVKTTEVGLSYGVIRNVDMDLTEQDILLHLAGPYEIMSARRLMRRNMDDKGAAWIPCESIRLGFKGASVPSHVFIYKMRVKVEPYIFPVTQCSRCWKFGHTLKFCPSKKIICPKCTKKHENCEITTFKCVNCHGSHMAMNKGCPIFKKERRVRELMSEFNVTYRKALSMYVPPTQASERLIRPPVYDEDTGQSTSGPIPDKSKDYTPFNGFSYSDKVKTPKAKKEPGPSQEQGSQEKEGTKRQIPEQNGLGVGRSRGKQKKRKLAQSSASTFDWDKDPSVCSEEEQPASKSRHGNMASKEANPTEKDYGFKQLLSKLMSIIFSGQSLGKKIELVVKECIEWVMSKIVSGISARSFFSSDHDYGF